MFAAQNGHAHIAQALLANDANANHVRADGLTVLMCAVHNGHEQVAEVLLATGANVNYAKADDSCTALMYAAQNGHDLCVSALIEYGADVNARNKQGGTALMLRPRTATTSASTSSSRTAPWSLRTSRANS